MLIGHQDRGVNAIYPGAGEMVEVVIPRLRPMRVRLANFSNGVERAEVPEAVPMQPKFAVSATVRPGRR